MRIVRAVAAGFCFVVATDAVVAASDGADTRTPLEIGLASGGVMSRTEGDGRDVRLMVTVSQTEHRSIEFFGGSYHGSDLTGVYGFQFRWQSTGNRFRSMKPFATVGLLGAVSHYNTYNCGYGSCRRQSKTVVLPPLLGLAGGGVQWAVTPRLAVRFDAQAGLLGGVVGVRVGAGVSVAVGK